MKQNKKPELANHSFAQTETITRRHETSCRVCLFSNRRSLFCSILRERIFILALTVFVRKLVAYKTKPCCTPVFFQTHTQIMNDKQEETRLYL